MLPRKSPIKKAEEGASASEELTAQSRQMQIMVNDLVALVGNRGRGISKSQRTLLLSETRVPEPARILKPSLPGGNSTPHLPGPEGEFKDF